MRSLSEPLKENILNILDNQVKYQFLTFFGVVVIGVLGGPTSGQKTPTGSTNNFQPNYEKWLLGTFVEIIDFVGRTLNLAPLTLN